MSEYTVTQIEAAILAALRAKDMPAVGGVMRLMAVTDPRRAEVLRDTMLLGITLTAPAPAGRDDGGAE